MKKKSSNYQNKLRNIIAVAFLSLSFSTYAQNKVDVEFSSTTNAVSSVSSGYSNGVDTYKTVTITIPFYSNHLDLLTFKTNYSCGGKSMINVNGVNSTYANNPITALHKWFEITNLPVGTTYYDVKTYCNFVEVPSRTQLMKIVIVKEVPPVLNLIISPKCSSSHGQYNGYINLVANGSYTNASKLFIKTTIMSANTATCTAQTLTNLVYLSNSNAPNNTLTNSSFFYCGSNGTYKVELFYKSTAANGGTIITKINSGTYGWNEYTYNRNLRFKCMNLIAHEHVLALRNVINIYPNPSSDHVSIVVDESEKIISYAIYDASGFLVSKADKLNAESNTVKIDITDLKEGFYIVNVLTDKENYKERLIKE